MEAAKRQSNTLQISIISALNDVLYVWSPQQYHNGRNACKTRELLDVKQENLAVVLAISQQTLSNRANGAIEPEHSDSF